VSNSRQLIYDTHFKKKKALIQEETKRINALVLPQSYTSSEYMCVLNDILHIKNAAQNAAAQSLYENEALSREIYDEFYNLNKAFKKIAGRLHHRLENHLPIDYELMTLIERCLLEIALNNIYTYPISLEELEHNLERLQHLDQQVERLKKTMLKLSSSNETRQMTETYIHQFDQNRFITQTKQQYNLATILIYRVESDFKTHSHLLPTIYQLLLAAKLANIAPPFVALCDTKLQKINQYMQNNAAASQPQAASAIPAHASASSSSTTKIATQLDAQNTFGLNLDKITESALYNFYHIFKITLVPPNQDHRFDYILGLDIDNTLAVDNLSGAKIEIIHAEELKAFLLQLPNNVKVVAITSRYYPEKLPHTAEMIIAEIEKFTGKNGIFHAIYHTSGYPKQPVLQHLHDTFIAPHTPDSPTASKQRVTLVDDAFEFNILPTRLYGFNSIHVIPSNSDHITKMYRTLNMSLPSAQQASAPASAPVPAQNQAAQSSILQKP
jgi:hypothetical protein